MSTAAEMRTAAEMSTAEGISAAGPQARAVSTAEAVCEGPIDRLVIEPDGDLLAKTVEIPIYRPEPSITDVADGQQSLRRGHYGETVELTQRVLVLAGHDLKLDGWFGPKTEAAVREYQRQNGLVPDGKVGAKTFEHLSTRYSSVPEVRDQALTVIRSLGGDPGARAQLDRLLADRSFQSLKSSRQAVLVSTFAEGRDSMFRDDVIRLANATGFKRLDAKSATVFATALGQLEAHPQARETLVHLAEIARFASLPDADRSALIAHVMIGTSGRELSAEARTVLLLATRSKEARAQARAHPPRVAS
ncbi:MAG: peptidoglycan-binding protein [Deltaproteobacteria bacterium]|nr:peptidoglycan-binding protein [Deltaproteobacteria bacterium]